MRCHRIRKGPVEPPEPPKGRGLKVGDDTADRVEAMLKKIRQSGDWELEIIPMKHGILVKPMSKEKKNRMPDADGEFDAKNF